MEALLGSLGAMGDAPARNRICGDAEDLQNQLRSLVASKSSDTRAELITTAFEFHYNTVFSIPVEHEAGDPVLQLQPPSIRAVNASEAVVNQPTDDPALQRLVAKHIADTVASADGSAWNVRQVSRGTQGWVFTYQCKHSLQAWLRQQGKNPDRPPIAAFHASVAQDPVNMSRPAFDCRGGVSIEFSKSTKAIVVKYAHIPLHKSVGELADRLTPVPPPPVMNGNHVANKSAKAKRPPPAEGEEGGRKKKPKRKSKAAAAAEDGSEDPTNEDNTATPSRELTATVPASQSAAPAPLIVSQAEAARRKRVAEDLLNGRGVDPASLSTEQMDIFANQAPHLQELSLEMLAKYGAERLRIVHPGEKNQAASADSTPAQQSTPVQVAAAPSTESTPATSDTPSKKKAPRKKKADAEPTNTLTTATGEAPAPENGGMATTSSTLEQLPRQRKTRGKCDTCRKRKVQCTKEHPECSVCQEAGETCVYLPPKPRRKSEKVDLADEEEDADDSVVGEQEGQAEQAEPPVPAVQPPPISLPASQADEVIQAAQAAHAAHVAQAAQVATAQAAHARHEGNTAQAAPSYAAHTPHMDEAAPAQATYAPRTNEIAQAAPAKAAAPTPRTRSSHAPTVDVDNDEFVPDPNILSGPIEQSVAQAQASSYSSPQPPEVTYTTQAPETTYENMATSETARHANQAIANLTFPPNQFHWETSQAAPSLTFPSATQSAVSTQQDSMYTQPAAQAQSQPAARNMTAAERHDNRRSLPAGPSEPRAEPGNATQRRSTQGWKQQASQSPPAPAPSSASLSAAAQPQAPQQRPRSRASGGSIDAQAADTMQAAVTLAQAASQRQAPQSSVMNRSPYQSTAQKPNPRTQSRQGQRSQSRTPVTQTAVPPPQLPSYASAAPTSSSAPTYASFAHYNASAGNQYSSTTTAGDSSSRIPYDSNTYRTQAPSTYTTPPFDYSRSTAADSLHHALSDASGYGSSTNGNHAHWTVQPAGSHSSAPAHAYNTDTSQTPPPNTYGGGRPSTRQSTQASHGQQSQSATYGSYPSQQPTATSQQQNQKWYGLAAANNGAAGAGGYSGSAETHKNYGNAGATAQAGSYPGHRAFENYGQGYAGGDDQTLYDLLRASGSGN